MKSTIQFAIAAAASALLLSGCAGYQLGDVKPGVYKNIKKLHVPPFKNLTLEPRISSLVANAVLAELQSDGTYQIATRADCDAVLVAEIREIRKSQLRAVRTDTLKSRELSVYLAVDFYLEDPQGVRIGERVAKTEQDTPRMDKDAAEDEVFGARQGRVIGETIQFVDPSYQVGERNALSVVSEDLADKLVSQLVNGW